MNLPVPHWLKAQTRLDTGDWNSSTKVYQFNPERLVLSIDQHNVVGFNISVHDTETLQGVQGRQQLQAQNKTGSIHLLHVQLCVVNVRVSLTDQKQACRTADVCFILQ